MEIFLRVIHSFQVAIRTAIQPIAFIRKDITRLVKMPIINMVILWAETIQVVQETL